MSATTFDSARFGGTPRSTLLRRARIALARHAAPQFLLVLAVWWAADTLVRITGLPLPGSILGLGLMLVLLGTGALPVSWLRRGAGFLLGHLMLFLVPPMLALLEHPELFSLTGLKLLGVILLGTLLVMSATALLVDLMMKRSQRHA
ncbi:CidA/LrgA family protein [Acetobacteraceae bacterium H6797]|nr:CidA/LrgA family protein [Acetobacteraceae bacterium H6797]